MKLSQHRTCKVKRKVIYASTLLLLLLLLLLLVLN